MEKKNKVVTVEALEQKLNKVLFAPVATAETAGISRRQLDYWVEIGLIVPEMIFPRGRAGEIKLFSHRDLMKLRMLKELLDAGLSTQALRKIKAEDMEKMLKEFDENELQSLYVITQDGMVKVDMLEMAKEIYATQADQDQQFTVVENERGDIEIVEE